MSKGGLFIAVAFSVALMGCKSVVMPFDSYTPKSGAQSYPCDKGRRCEATIVSPSCSGSVCTASVDHDPLDLLQDKMRTNTNVNIFWHFLDDGYGFCPALGDGVYLTLASDGQIDKQYQTDDTDGNNPHPGTPNKSYKHYYWRDQNTKAPPEGSSYPYQYTIIFHRVDHNQCPQDQQTGRYVVDPWVVNH